MDNLQKNNVKNALGIAATSIVGIISAALLLFSLLAFFYTVVIGIALQSAMAVLVALACAVISAGIGLALFEFFLKRLKKHISSAPESSAEAEKASKTKKYKNKVFSISNIGFAFMLLGSVLAIVSAFLGSTDRDSWVLAKTDFMEANGYYADLELVDLNWDRDVSKISIKLDKKYANIKYTTQPNAILEVSWYQRYQNQISCSYDDINKTLIIEETHPPELDNTLAKLMFFIFDENSVEYNVLISIPSEFSSVSIVYESVN